MYGSELLFIVKSGNAYMLNVRFNQMSVLTSYEVMITIESI